MIKISQQVEQILQGVKTAKEAHTKGYGVGHREHLKLEAQIRTGLRQGKQQAQVETLGLDGIEAQRIDREARKAGQIPSAFHKVMLSRLEGVSLPEMVTPVSVPDGETVQ